jgi:hypothetical protein
MIGRWTDKGFLSTKITKRHEKKHLEFEQNFNTGGMGIGVQNMFWTPIPRMRGS